MWKAKQMILPTNVQHLFSFVAQGEETILKYIWSEIMEVSE